MPYLVYSLVSQVWEGVCWRKAYSFFKSLVGTEVRVELKNDITIRGTIRTVDQFLNIKLGDISVENDNRFPHLVSAMQLLWFYKRIMLWQEQMWLHPVKIKLNHTYLLMGVGFSDNSQSSIKGIFIRGSTVGYVHMPASSVDVALLEDATRRGRKHLLIDSTC